MIDSKPSTQRIAVIGSGLAGLASACTLAARGYKVHVFEANTWLGGKAAQLAKEGFRFDMGPTILTMPRVLERIFSEAGENLSDHLELIRLDPQWRCFFDDGEVLDLRENTADMQSELTRFAKDDTTADQYASFIEYTQRLADISERFFFWRSIGGIKDMMKLNTTSASTLGDVLAMRMGSTVAGTVRKYVPEKRVAQMLDHFTQYVGSSPYGSPAILCGIASMQVNEGVWYPKGGTRAVPEALVALGKRLGVTYQTDSRVSKILTGDDAVSGIELDDGTRFDCAAVVSNMDAIRTYRELLDDNSSIKDRPGDREPACSGIVLYLGLNKGYDHLAHHDFVFSRDPKEEFDYIYKKGEPAPDPSCYLAVSSKTEPQVAPPGGEALYVLVHTPYLRPHHDWSRNGKLFRDYRQTILNKLKRTAGMADIESRITFEESLTPQDIHDRYRVLNGAIYGLASHGRLLGAFKPANRRKTRGLYLAGGAAHPGPGMPMVMMSGWIAADSLDQDRIVQPVPPTPSASIVS